jgi:hypothetical protein
VRATFGASLALTRCRSALIAEMPPDASSNRALSLWACAAHNVVNRRLHKPEFPCTLDALRERWGDCGCFDAKPEVQ